MSLELLFTHSIFISPLQELLIWLLPVLGTAIFDITVLRKLQGQNLIYKCTKQQQPVLRRPVPWWQLQGAGEHCWLWGGCSPSSPVMWEMWGFRDSNGALFKILGAKVTASKRSLISICQELDISPCPAVSTTFAKLHADTSYVQRTDTSEDHWLETDMAGTHLDKKCRPGMRGR